MITIQRLFDIPYYQLENYPNQNMFVTKSNGRWVGISTVNFIEKVRAFTLEDFTRMMDEAGIFLLDTFGDYKLKKFLKKDSERLIMIFK